MQLRTEASFRKACESTPRSWCLINYFSDYLSFYGCDGIPGGCAYSIGEAFLLPQSQHYFYNVSDSASISVLTSLAGTWNTGLVAEIGYSAGFESLLNKKGRSYTPDSYHGLDDKDVIELALWQVESPWFFDKPIPNPTLSELAGQYQDVNGVDMFATGIRCTSSSAAGTAENNGLTGRYTNFQREDPDSMYGIPRLGPMVASILLPGRTRRTTFNQIYDPTAPKATRESGVFRSVSGRQLYHRKKRTGRLGSTTLHGSRRHPQ